MSLIWGADLDVHLAKEDIPLGMPLVEGIWENSVCCSGRNGSDIVMTRRNKNITSCANRRPYEVAQRDKVEASICFAYPGANLRAVRW